MKYTVEQFDEQLEAGPYAWPGGYPLYFVCADGEALSFAAAKENATIIRDAMRTNPRHRHDEQWCVIGCEINWEDGALYCAHSNERIESAYAEPENDK